MASGRLRTHRNGSYWELKFRGFPTERRALGGRPIRAIRRISAPAAARIAKKAHADAWAARLESLHELAYAGDTAAIRELLEYSLLTPNQADALARNDTTATVLEPHAPPAYDTITITQAALDHPATVRERAKPEEFKRHAAELRKFLDRPGAPTLLKNLRESQILEYVESMKRDTVPRATRNHRLLWLKRAAARAPTYGLANPIAGVILDPDDGTSTKPTTTCSLAELARIALYLEGRLPPIDPPKRPEEKPLKSRWAKYTAPIGDPRALAAFGLMALCGLSPREVIRLRVGDYDNGILHIGRNGAKNIYRVRPLAVPAIVQEWITAAIGGRHPDAPILQSASPKKPGTHMTISGFGHWLSPRLREATGLPISNAILRASFATCGIWEIGLEERHVEAYLGHSMSKTAGVTNRHYLALARARDLRPAAQQIDTAFRAAYDAELIKLNTQHGHTKPAHATNPTTSALRKHLPTDS